MLGNDKLVTVHLSTAPEEALKGRSSVVFDESSHSSVPPATASNAVTCQNSSHDLFVGATKGCMETNAE